MLITIFITMQLLQISATAQSYLNFTAGSSLLANPANSTWLSPSGDFAFGFQQVSPQGYLLAIWFDQIPEKTIVWSANRDDLAPQGSRIQISANGRFELDDPTGRRIWSAKLDAAAAYGAMLDTGDFVLASNSSIILWRSFSQPTDTLLPTVIQLNQDTTLISSLSETNYSRGRFNFVLQSDGNLVLQRINYPLDSSDFVYWSTQIMGPRFQFIFDQSGNIYLTAQNGTILRNLSTTGAAAGEIYQRLTLDYDGILRHYVYQKSGGSAAGRATGWSVSTFFPSNICLQMGGNLGDGACGLNSLCWLGTDQRPRCSCPAGYSPVDPNDRMSGCKQDFLPQRCDADDDHVFGFDDMLDTDWPFSDYAHFSRVSEDWCRGVCLSDCFCDVAIYRDGNCWKKKMPLSNGKIDPSVGGKALVKIRRSNATMRAGGGGERNRSGLIIAGSVLLGSSVFLNLLLLSSLGVFLLHVKSKSKSKTKMVPAVHPGMNLRCFSFAELEEATEGFKVELGRGAGSTVYKGVDNGSVVAVKKLHKVASEREKEFEAEVRSIGRTNHKNLVQLLGYCDEGQNKLLVYEFMSNGSLAEFVFENSTRPHWYRRVQIAFATARGLCYLHQECSTQIIHCDIKPQNVLLDESHKAKISDFGLAKLLAADQTRTTTGIRGTRGYVAPEWFRNLPITAKVDVYSYGILLLELVCCRRNFEAGMKDERAMILADWAYDCYKDGALEALVVDDEEAAAEMNQFEKLVMIGLWCIQEDPTLRPQMKRVMHMLEGSAQVPAPPDPASFIN